MSFSSFILLVTYAVFEIAAVFCVIRAVKTARTPQGSVGWVIFLLAAPHFAVPLFLFLGHSRYPGYVAIRRDMETISRSLHNRAAPASAPAADHPQNRHLAAFAKLAELPWVGGNSTELLIDGQVTFAAIFDAIASAKSYILVQFYTFHDDDLGRDMATRLKARARDGIKVMVLYDAIGSSGLPRAYVDDLRQAGVQIHDFHAIRRKRSRFQVNFRNHRKNVVIDGQTGFVGGHNVGDEYLGRNPRLGHWRDTHLRLSGPVVAQLQLAFSEDWLWSTGDKPDLNWHPTPQAQDRSALILTSGPADKLETGSLYFINAIEMARSRIWIASPYFVPDADILNALKLAALRGVQVRLLVPDARDHWLVWLAAFAYFDEVRAAGVAIHRYTDGFTHQKVILVDDDLASVGSINLDNRSCRLNFEVTALVHDAGFAAEVAVMLTADFAKAPLFTLPLGKQKSFLRRNAPLFARLFAPIL